MFDEIPPPWRVEHSMLFSGSNVESEGSAKSPARLWTGRTSRLSDRGPRQGPRSSGLRGPLGERAAALQSKKGPEYFSLMHRREAPKYP
jgi:hypothetical protein